MGRQLQLYDLIAGVRNGAIYSPTEIMAEFGISRRMLQRDLKDLRDCGLIKVKYDKAKDRYVPDGEATFDESAPPKRKAHLLRLHRIGTLLHGLTRIDSHYLEAYEFELQEFYEYLEDVKDNPENNSPEDIELMRKFYLLHDIEFTDLKAEYYALFPDSNERTRQRDFAEMYRAGFEIYYSREHKTFIYAYDFRKEDS